MVIYMIYSKIFSELSKNDTLIAGGKGASLGEMINANIPVPDGFVILSNTFDKFLETTGVNIKIEAILKKINSDEVRAVEDASKKIQTLVLNSKIPEEIIKEVEGKFKKLNCKYVAVRSSATAEDSASAAWAGQLDSFLNTNEDSLLENIKKCWASLFTPRAIFYRFEKKLNNQKISVAVVVQRMIESDVSGIAFSVHPVTEDRNQIIIEAGFGLGEAIVSGQITPDSYVFAKNEQKIIDKNIYTQKKGIFRDDKKGGNRWKNIPKNEAKEQCLSDKQIIELSKLIVKIENHYNFPCDIEWAMENGKFYIVQSRPITTLAVSQKKNICNQFIEYMKATKGGLYVPVNNVAILTETHWRMQDYFSSYYKKITQISTFTSMRQGEGAFYFSQDLLLDTASEIFDLYWGNKNVLKNIKSKFEIFAKDIDKLYFILNQDYVEKNSLSKLIKDLNLLMDDLWHINALVFFSLNFDKDFCSEGLKKKNLNIDLEKIWEKAVIPTSCSFDQNRQKFVLSLIIKGEKWPKILEKCRYFGAAYNVVKSLDEIEKELLFDYKKKTKKMAATELSKIEQSEFDKKAKFETWKKTLKKDEKYLADYIQFIIWLRDIRKDYLNKGITRLYDVTRKIFLEERVDEGLIMYYSYDELLKGRSYLNSVSLELQDRKKDGVSFLYYNDNYYYEVGNFGNYQTKIINLYNKNIKDESDCNIIYGKTGAVGKVVGIARIIKNTEIDSPKFRSGEILVTGMTRPEFLPLMKKSIAFVTDEGGVTCHAAIVAREMKKPCVIGTKFATQVICDGDEIEVDADNGVVRIIKKL